MVNLTLYTLNPNGQRTPLKVIKRVTLAQLPHYIKKLSDSKHILEIRVPSTGFQSFKEYDYLKYSLKDAPEDLHMVVCDPHQTIALSYDPFLCFEYRDFQGKFYAYYFNSSNVQKTLININRWDTILGFFQEYGYSFTEPIHISIRGAKRMKISLEEIKNALKETTNTEIIIEC